MFKFRCRKCGNTFTVEQHPLFQNFIDRYNAQPKRPFNDEALKSFIDTILEITKQIRCQQCQATVRLVSIGNLNIEEGIDISSEPLVRTIKSLVELHKEYSSKISTPNSFLKYSDEVRQYAQEITEHLMWHPGTLVHIEDTELMNEAKITIDELWQNLSEDELLDEMFSGGFSGLLADIVVVYVDKLKMIKPTFISIKPTNEVKTYFQQAMDAWTHGLNTASLILSCSILEAIFKEVLIKKDVNLVYDTGNGKSLKNFRFKEREFEVLIENAKRENILNDYEAKKADNIRKMRNAAVHKLKQSSSEETYKAIITTKELIEKLLK